MGSPKQLLKWGNSTLIEHTIKTVLELNPLEVVVVLGANYKLIKKGIDTFSITILNNTTWQEGIGNSIACAANYLKKSKCDGCLITLADQPLITTNYLKKIIKSFTPNKHEIIATKYNTGKAGVPVLFDKAYLSELQLLKNDKGANAIVVKHQDSVKVVKNEVEVTDIDTLQDYIELKAKSTNN